jgi:hypothetical protein
VKSRKPLAENSMTSDLRLSSNLSRCRRSCRRSDVAGAGHCQHLVVMVRAHRNGAHASPRPRAGDAGHRFRRGLGRRDQDARVAVKTSSPLCAVSQTRRERTRKNTRGSHANDEQ